MTVQMISRRTQRPIDAPPPPATVAQRVSDESQDLSLRLKALFSGWSFLSALEFVQMSQMGLPELLDSLCRALQPRFAQKTLVAASGKWFRRTLGRAIEAGDHCERDRFLQIAVRRCGEAGCFD